jgi:organic radical activating enzyme
VIFYCAVDAAQIFRIITMSNNFFNDPDFGKIRIHDSSSMLSHNTNLDNRYCKALYRRLEVSVDGRCWLCCPMWLPYPIGNLNENTLEEIWNGPLAQTIRAQMFTNNWDRCIKSVCPDIVSDSLWHQDDVLRGGKAADGSTAIKNKLYDWEITGVENKSLTPYKWPVEILLGTDESCNLFCPSCRKAKIMHTSGSEYERRRELTQRVLDGVLEIDPEQEVKLIITGSGDPFGSKVFREALLEMDGRNNPNLQIHFQTNGVMLTPKTWNNLYKLHDNISNIQISFDAATAETYETKTRIGGHWDTLLKNCDYLDANAPERARISYDFVVQAANYREMPAYIELIKNRYPNAVGINFSLVLDWRTWTPEEYSQQAIWKPSHPQHSEFLEVLKDPAFVSDRRIVMGNMKVYHQYANRF